MTFKEHKETVEEMTPEEFNRYYVPEREFPDEYPDLSETYHEMKKQIINKWKERIEEEQELVGKEVTMSELSDRLIGDTEYSPDIDPEYWYELNGWGDTLYRNDLNQEELAILYNWEPVKLVKDEDGGMDLENTIVKITSIEGFEA